MKSNLTIPPHGEVSPSCTVLDRPASPEEAALLKAELAADRTKPFCIV